MNGEPSFDRIEAIFLRAQEIEGAERAIYLDRVCGGDERLRREVESLLVVEPVGTEGVRRRLTEELSEPAPLLAAGDRIAGYRIVEPLGEGGMGEVYRADQSTPLQREVALKVIKAGLDTRQLLRRFDLERQALARMSHPGIAQVFDAGVTEQARPFFVMELVHGSPITDHCDERALGIDRRLELFLSVCGAVQHAHQRGVIHRDLKPSNILVEEHEGKPRPKIIDFGIAKAAQPEVDDATVATRFGQIVGTPEYMSPEQAELEGVVDTRTDVYSLGVVLYELVAGCHPFDVERLRRSGLDAVRRYLRETDPEHPSARLTRLGETAERVAAERGCDPATLRRALRGDIDFIVARALEKDPDRRYSSAAELAADLERHLRHEPVLAGPPSRLYRARKFVRRHRLPVAAGAVVAASLLVAVIGISVALARSQRSEADAQRQAAVAEQVIGVLTGLFEADDPYASDPKERTLREVVRGAADALDTIDDPEVFARVALVLGDVLSRQGLREDVDALLERATRQLEGAGLERSSPIYLDLLSQHSHVKALMGRYQESRDLADRLLELADRVLADDPARMGAFLKQRGDAEVSIGGTSEDALSWYRRALEVLEAAPEAAPETLAVTYRALAAQLTDPEACREAGHEALRIWSAIYGPAHPRVAEATNALAHCASRSGDALEAARLYRSVVEMRQDRLGEANPLTLESVVSEIDALYSLGRFDQAKALIDRFLPVARRSSWGVGIGSLLNASFTYLPAEADFDRNRRRLDEAIDVFVDLFGGETEYSLMARHTRADGYADEGRFEEARERYLEVLETRRRLGIADNFFQALLLDNVATVERRLGLLEAASQHLDAALALYPDVQLDPRYHARAWVDRASLLHALGQAEASESAFRRAQEIYATCRGPATFLDLRVEAAWRALRGERDAARELARSMLRMGVHPDFLGHEPELAELLGPAALRSLASDVRD